MDLSPHVPATIPDPISVALNWKPLSTASSMTRSQRDASKGIDTRRRFYGCSVNVCSSCIENGRNKLWVVEWLDDDWPDSLKRALLKLWDMYEKSRHGRVKDNLDQDEVNKKLSEEKQKIELERNQLVDDVNELFDAQEKRVHEYNHQKIMKGDYEDQKIGLMEHAIAQGEEERAKMEKENIKLKNDLQQLKLIQAAQAWVIKNIKMKAEEEREQLKLEKKKLEYNIADLLKALDENRSKLNRIKGICDE